MAGIGVILASAVGFSWAATDAKDLERQKALRYHLSGKFTDGDEELVKHVKRRASMFHPETPEQILHMQQTRHELTGKLVPRLTENR